MCFSVESRTGNPLEHYRPLLLWVASFMYLLVSWRFTGPKAAISICSNHSEHHHKLSSYVNLLTIDVSWPSVFISAQNELKTKVMTTAFVYSLRVVAKHSSFQLSEKLSSYQRVVNFNASGRLFQLLQVQTLVDHRQQFYSARDDPGLLWPWTAELSEWWTDRMWCYSDLYILWFMVQTFVDKNDRSIAQQDVMTCSRW